MHAKRLLAQLMGRGRVNLILLPNLAGDVSYNSRNFSYLYSLTVARVITGITVCNVLECVYCVGLCVLCWIVFDCVGL